jgi:hypothetical protein
MNNLFFGLLCTVIGAAIGGIITISSPQAQRSITNSLIAATCGISAVWAGYGLGRWKTKKELTQETTNTVQNLQSSRETTQIPVFRITYPHTEVASKDNVKGSFEKLTEEDEKGIWLYVYDYSVYRSYKVRNYDRLRKQWQVENITFGQPDTQDDGKTYDIRVIWATEEASNELSSSEEQGLRQLPESIKSISEKVTVKRKVFF